MSAPDRYPPSLAQASSHRSEHPLLERRCLERDGRERVPARDPAINFWLHALEFGMASMDSSIVDLGCGYGRYAMLISGYELCGNRFRGRYTGIDLDREMIEWCRGYFNAEHFRLDHADLYNSVYNPDGVVSDQEYSFPLNDRSQHFVFAGSLYKHLLEGGISRFIAETYRVLASDGWMEAAVCCADTVQGELDGRWTFLHSMGNAFVESAKHPEAAVAYRTSFLIQLCRQAGLKGSRSPTIATRA